KSLQRLLAEGEEGRCQRYRAAAQQVRQALRGMGFETYIPDAIASDLITVVVGRSDAPMDELRAYLASERGILVSGGLERLAGQVMRVGHMGKASSDEYTRAFLEGVSQWLRQRRPS
ncbi:MAG: hypothetical protein GX605_01105, partial [Chloroflexi bacterium]|nr:hypothetical protein [Chloroflexota bacterium]